MLFLLPITKWQGKVSMNLYTQISFNPTQLNYVLIIFTFFSLPSYNSILLDYNFNKLEDIWFTSASHLTLATMELLMDRLPELSSIGKCMIAIVIIIIIIIISSPFDSYEINLYVRRETII
jgi:hypothetical protein